MSETARKRCDGTSLLRLLVEAKGPMTLDAMCAAMTDGTKPARRRLVKVNLLLIGRGAVERAGKVHGPAFGQVTVSFKPTKLGRDLVATGQVIKRGPHGPHNGNRAVVAGTFRESIWQALRYQKDACTITDLVELVAKPDDDASANINNARRYLTGLVRAGIVKVMPVKSGSFLRYRLLRDLGKRTPSVGGKWLTDPNAPDSAAARIPYTQKAKP